MKSYQLFLWLFLSLVAQGKEFPEKLPAIPMGIPMSSGPGRTAIPMGIPTAWLVAQRGWFPEKLPAIPLRIPMASGPGRMASRKSTSYFLCVFLRLVAQGGQLFLWAFLWLVVQGGGFPEKLPAILMGVPMASGPGRGTRVSRKGASYPYGYSYG